jgi:hypothetical protein
LDERGRAPGCEIKIGDVRAQEQGRPRARTNSDAGLLQTQHRDSVSAAPNGAAQAPPSFRRPNNKHVPESRRSRCQCCRSASLLETPPPSPPPPPLPPTISLSEAPPSSTPSSHVGEDLDHAGDRCGGVDDRDRDRARSLSTALRRRSPTSRISSLSAASESSGLSLLARSSENLVTGYIWPTCQPPYTSLL